MYEWICVSMNYSFDGTSSSTTGYFQIQPAAQNFVSHEIFKKLSEPIQWMTKPTSSPKKTFGTASSLQKRS